MEAQLSLPFAQVRERLGRLPGPLREHVERVAREAVALARCHGVDPVAADFAALAHDLFRVEPSTTLLDCARSYRIPVDAVRERTPILVHGAVTAEWLRRELGVHDHGILSAVQYHTTGRPGMSPLEMVVFLADKTEPGRQGESPGWDDVREAARHRLEGALLLFLERHVEHLRAQGLPVLDDTSATLAWVRSRRGP
ncbi:MAG: bis(5'-nucleosyl)-tetraphosphatase (symmetrical) YqeK [Chloroflexi bacterium]|nr:bis(5'-nucleosyl)-tetraphosphatase (symmetrical) YqeK [Chloroflexota bacterium]